MKLKILVLSALALTFSSAQASCIIGTFDSTRGGIGSFQSNQTSTVRNAITSNISGSSFTSSSTINSAFLNTIDVLMISSVSGGTTAITPLSASEQTDLANWVTNGGKALLFVDNDSFNGTLSDPANESLLDPFGLDTTGTFNGSQGITTSGTGPIANGAFGTVNTSTFLWTGYFDNLNGATSHATLNANNQSVIASLQVGSGAVVFFSDVSFTQNGSTSASGNTLILNSLDYVKSVPEPTTLALLSLAALPLIKKRRK